MALLHLVVFALTGLLMNNRVAVSDGEEQNPHQHDVVVVNLKDGSATYVRAGQPVATTGRSILIELLEGQASGPLENKTGLPDAFDRPGIEKLLENERVTVWRYTWAFGKRTPMHFHANDVVVVYRAEGVLASITQDGMQQMNPNSFGFTKFSPRGRVHQEELVKGQASAVMVELK